jgi:predicted AAA+ superfamily ATPase
MFKDIRLALASLCIYRGILDDMVIKRFIELLDTLMNDTISELTKVDCYHEFIFNLAHTGQSFKDHLLYLIAHDNSPFSKMAELQKYADLDPALLQAVRSDLAYLQKIYDFDWHQVPSSGAECLVDQNSTWADLELEPLIQVLDMSHNWADETEKLAAYYRTHGSGLISRFRALRWDNRKNRIIGIDSPDPVLLKDLVGYQTQKNQLCSNTEQFLQGFPANNVLLYGSRGTGKSTMVKALLNEYYCQGLRMVEIACEDLGCLPEIISALRKHALKFIIFIDDLSFEDYETQYKGLKAVMEGSLESRPDNVLLYATSNRRHLVREFHSERTQIDDEIHINDTMQEKLSLADRFGLTITFPSPTQQAYLEIVETIAGQRHLNIDPELLRRRALQWERAHHGPSGRTARQFVDSLGG